MVPPKPALKQTGLFDEADDEPELDMFSDDTKKPAPVPSRSLNLPNLRAMVNSQAPPKPAGEELQNTEKPWVRPGLMLSCLNTELGGGKYTKRRGVVERIVEDGWGVELRMIESLDVLLLDQDDCSPVVPGKSGDPVIVIRGQYAGLRGSFQEISADGRDAVIELQEGPRRRLISIPVANVCAYIDL